MGKIYTLFMAVAVAILLFTPLMASSPSPGGDGYALVGVDVGASTVAPTGAMTGRIFERALTMADASDDTLRSFHRVTDTPMSDGPCMACLWVQRSDPGDGGDAARWNSLLPEHSTLLADAGWDKPGHILRE